MILPANDRRAWPAALVVFALTFAVYNANGREIASQDSQPTKLAAIELARYHKLTLDRPVLLTPGLESRPGFARDRDNHYRSAYPLLPTIAAGGVAWLLHAFRLVDLAAPRAAGLVAKLTASLLVALGVACVFLVARRRTGRGRAVLVAIGFGLGTNVWPVASQTMWQVETVVFALSASVLCLAVPHDKLAAWRLWIGALLLGCAGAARPQLVPAIAILGLSIAVRRGKATDVFALVPLAGMALSVVALNLRWFGHPLGAIPRLESLHPAVHAVTSSFGNPIVGAVGLLVSPSRGLLVFSPIVLVAVAGLPTLLREGWRDDLRWWGVAAAAQLAFYSCYSVWWGGHTFGPRYLLDVLPFLVPLAAAGMSGVLASRSRRVAVVAALAWSLVVAGTGAFFYPNDRWNTDPTDVDRQHERLWDWRDPQIVRCWRAGPSPQNFALLATAAFRRPPRGSR